MTSTPTALMTTAGIPHHPLLVRLAACLDASLDMAGGCLLFWWHKDWRGLAAEDVRVTPGRDPAQSCVEWSRRLSMLPEDYLNLARQVERGITGGIPGAAKNWPKTWVREWAAEVSEVPGVALEVGITDYRTSTAIAAAYNSSLAFGDSGMTLRELYECRRLSYTRQLPGEAVAHIAILSADGYLVFGQRSPQVAGAAGRYSFSCEERWDPSKFSDPVDVVRDCLEDEWGLVDSVVHPANAVRLMALGREWGAHWNTALLYVVTVACGHDEVLRSWARARGRHEHRGVGVLPIVRRGARRVLFDALRGGQVGEVLLGTARKAGDLAPGDIHDGTGVVRAILALGYLLGPATLSDEWAWFTAQAAAGR
jgi:hypothetical protein